MNDHDVSDVGAARPTVRMLRVARAVQKPGAEARVIQFLQMPQEQRTDADWRQYAEDCTDLMELANERYEAFQHPYDHEHAVLWAYGRHIALRELQRRGHEFVDLGR